MKVVCIIAAAGMGERLGTNRPKLWAEAAGKPIIYHTLKAIDSVASISECLLMAPASEIVSLERELPNWGLRKTIKILPGGEKRQDTTRIALDSLPKDTEIVVIHDAARPLATKVLFDNTIATARKTGAATVAVAPVDTVVQTNNNDIAYLDRTKLRLIQTPQAFKAEVIKKAHRAAIEGKYDATDDCGLVKKIGLPVEIVEGDPENFKVTYPIDLVRLEYILKERLKK